MPEYKPPKREKFCPVYLPLLIHTTTPQDVMNVSHLVGLFVYAFSVRNTTTETSLLQLQCQCIGQNHCHFCTGGIGVGIEFTLVITRNHSILYH